MWAWVRLVQKWEHVVKRCESMVLFTRDTTKLRANASHVNVGQRINKRDNESITTPPRYERYWKYLKHLVSFACIIRLTVYIIRRLCLFIIRRLCQNFRKCPCTSVVWWPQEGFLEEQWLRLLRVKVPMHKCRQWGLFESRWGLLWATGHSRALMPM